MDPFLLKLAIGLFLVGSLFGLHVLTHIFKDKPTPKLAVLFHGLIGGTALLLVILYAFYNPDGAPLVSLILLLLAAGGGFTMLYFDLNKRPIPKAIAVMHPLIAVAGLVALILFVMQ